MTLLDDLSASVEQVKIWLADRKPQLAIVLGSGLTSILDQLEDSSRIAYSDICDFPSPAVDGHAGYLFSGNLFGRSVVVFQGRYHCYEGYSAWQVTAQVRLAAAVGCQSLLLTNAAGGIADELQPGDFMLVADHVNLTGESPMRGRPEREFTDLSNLYRHDFSRDLQSQLQDRGVNLRAGVLAWMLGPNYETPAEIKLLQTIGASAVSMSTIPEAIVARRYGLEVIAVSYISNLAAGKSTRDLAHQDVLSSGESAASSLKTLFTVLLDRWPH